MPVSWFGVLSVAAALLCAATAQLPSTAVAALPFVWTNHSLSSARNGGSALVIPTNGSGTSDQVDGKFMYCGGFVAPSTYSRACDTYNLVTAEWSSDANALSVPRSGMSAERAGSKFVFAGGATTSGTLSPVCEVYDHATDTWDHASHSLSSGARSGMCSTVLGTKAYFAGGQNLLSALVSAIDIYDSVTDTWDTNYSLTVARSTCSAVAGNNIILFTGGLALGLVPTSQVDMYDASTNQWSSGSLPGGVRYAHDSINAGDVLYIIGGRRTLGVRTDDIERFHTSQKVWLGTIWHLAVARAFDTPRASSFANQFYVLPGDSSGGDTNIISVYNNLSSSALAEIPMPTGHLQAYTSAMVTPGVVFMDCQTVAGRILILDTNEKLPSSSARPYISSSALPLSSSALPLSSSAELLSSSAERLSSSAELLSSSAVLSSSAERLSSSAERLSSSAEPIAPEPLSSTAVPEPPLSSSAEVVPPLSSSAEPASPAVSSSAAAAGGGALSSSALAQSSTASAPPTHLSSSASQQETTVSSSSAGVAPKRNDCASSPCQNGGTCVAAAGEADGGFTCACVTKAIDPNAFSNFTGSVCQNYGSNVLPPLWPNWSRVIFHFSVPIHFVTGGVTGGVIQFVEHLIQAVMAATNCERTRFRAVAVDSEDSDTAAVTTVQRLKAPLAVRFEVSASGGFRVTIDICPPEASQKSTLDIITTITGDPTIANIFPDIPIRVDSPLTCQNTQGITIACDSTVVDPPPGATQLLSATEVIGLVLAGGIVFSLILSYWFFCKRRRARARTSDNTPVGTPAGANRGNTAAGAHAAGTAGTSGGTAGGVELVESKQRSSPDGGGSSQHTDDTDPPTMAMMNALGATSPQPKDAANTARDAGAGSDGSMDTPPSQNTNRSDNTNPNSSGRPTPSPNAGHARSPNTPGASQHLQSDAAVAIAPTPTGQSALVRLFNAPDRGGAYIPEAYIPGDNEEIGMDSAPDHELQYRPPLQHHNPNNNRSNHLQQPHPQHRSHNLQVSSGSESSGAEYVHYSNSSSGAVDNGIDMKHSPQHPPPGVNGPGAGNMYPAGEMIMRVPMHHASGGAAGQHHSVVGSHDANDNNLYDQTTTSSSRSGEQIVTLSAGQRAAAEAAAETEMAEALAFSEATAAAEREAANRRQRQDAAVAALAMAEFGGGVAPAIVTVPVPAGAAAGARVSPPVSGTPSPPPLQPMSPTGVVVEMSNGPAGAAAYPLSARISYPAPPPTAPPSGRPPAQSASGGGLKL